MKMLAELLLSKTSTAGVEYSDVRVEENEGTTIRAAGDQRPEIQAVRTAGYSVRVLVDGAWGFAAGQRTDKKGLDEAVYRAVAMARASAAFSRRKIKLAPVETVKDHWVTPVAKDPFAVSLDRKIELLRSVNKALRGEYITQSLAVYNESRQKKVLATSEGTFIEQDLTECGGGFGVFASDGVDVQRRTYPSSDYSDTGSAGFEYFENLDLEGKAPSMAEEAERLLFAKPCPTKNTTVVIAPRHMLLQIHESAGHALELDRVYDYEKTLSGGTFLDPMGLDNFRYGSELVNITADATFPTGRGTFGYDDEGVPAQKNPLIKNGILVNYLSSRETAERIGMTSTGAARADSWNHVPLVRMTNVNLEPGDASLEQLIGEVDDGVYLDTPKLWSIDSLRLNFQFGTELGREIKNGKLGDYIKNPTYSGITPRFWAGCDAVGDVDTWKMTGLGSCGKGEPLQFGVRIGHGAPVARFRNVQIGV